MPFLQLFKILGLTEVLLFPKQVFNQGRLRQRNIQI